MDRPAAAGADAGGVRRGRIDRPRAPRPDRSGPQNDHLETITPLYEFLLTPPPARVRYSRGTGSFHSSDYGARFNGPPPGKGDVRMRRFAIITAAVGASPAVAASGSAAVLVADFNAPFTTGSRYGCSASGVITSNP